MKTKNFLAAGIAGGITDFLLGWLLYGMLFYGYFGGGEPNLALIFGGCLAFGFLISYIYVKWASIMTFLTGLRAGVAIGLIMGLMNNFFRWSMENPVSWEKFAVDVAICIVMAAVVGGVVGAVNGAMSKTTE